MDTYSFLRELADSWALLALTLVFLGVILWALRPGSNAIHRDAANAIFRNEQQPAGSDKDLRPVKEA
ncbi:cbb3-type cytochrome c oxidase subunit 3 [Tabrizicola oligotrophica]|uniref:Cbb3-type cytochrome c oxidase subunit 3 n=1 Tax=Tabrizicola oligotrophica TaxID=2710650 RepID=A0A6M0QRV8_9RHOB|nr:cbb3-type cytochrome c oxidase subunit 3 [Tabrizicola oligotrophica]NEY89711.1 cbb3-type cytochrome c oxidase subunit 3 [Tabrizicola oligotrophica]